MPTPCECLAQCSDWGEAVAGMCVPHPHRGEDETRPVASSVSQPSLARTRSSATRIRHSRPNSTELETALSQNERATDQSDAGGVGIFSRCTN
eukprot:741678-Prorocentrum_minimum.AAC.2